MVFTRSLMVASAGAMLLIGLICSFAPAELLASLGALDSAPLRLLVQVTGSLYLAFAALNWMARENLIGGIYSRPLAVGNLLHFLMSGLAMVRVLADQPPSSVLWALTLVYICFAACFGVVLFRHPIRSR
jgi:hypothetical protein